MDKRWYITHKSPRPFMLERQAWLAGKTCGSVARVDGGQLVEFSISEYSRKLISCSY
ncbi:MAG: hypothetical protein IPL81_06445 [Flavobacteriales bacterium]|nr:hypothetical protein [Flavobacteriales bacterium]